MSLYKQTGRFTRFLLCISAIIVTSLLLFIILFKVAFQKEYRRLVNGTDFRAFYTGITIVSHEEKENLYGMQTQYYWQKKFIPELRNEKQLLPYLLPPFVAVLLFFLSSFNFYQAYFLWGVLSLFLFISLYFFFLKLLNALPRQNIPLKIYFIFSYLCFLPLWSTVLQGQISLLLTWVLVGGWYVIRKEEDIKGGILLSLTLMKPQFFIIILLAFVFQKRIRVLQGILFGVTVLFLISYAALGSKGLQNYMVLLHEITAIPGNFGYYPKDMVNWMGFLTLSLKKESFFDVFPLWLMGSVICLGILFVTWRKRYNNSKFYFDIQFTILLYAVLFTAPYMYFHDVGILIICSFLAIYMYSQYTVKSFYRWMLLFLPLFHLFGVIVKNYVKVNFHLLTIIFIMGIIGMLLQLKAGYKFKKYL